MTKTATAFRLNNEQIINMVLLYLLIHIIILQGKWKIEVNGYIKAFHVKKYILPRFQVKVFAARIIYTGTKHFYFHVCAKYPYGEHVQGTALMKISYSVNSEIKELHKTKEVCINNRTNVLPERKIGFICI